MRHTSWSLARGVSFIFVFSFVGILGTLAPTARAATFPPLGAAASFSVLANTAITSVPTSVISGDVGLNAAGTNYAGLTSAEVAGTIYDTAGTGPDGAAAIISPNVQANVLTAHGNIMGQSSDGSIGPALDGLVVTPGVYDIGAGRLTGGILTLDGDGVYIFRASSDFVTSGSLNLINGATACNVFWDVDTLATINGSSFVGTIIAGTGIHFGSDVSLDGRALARGGDVTMISDTISGPSCAAPVSSGGNTNYYSGTITVVKTIVNDNGGNKDIEDFSLFINGISVVSGIPNAYVFYNNAIPYTVSETADPAYAATFSGDCDSSGRLYLSPAQNAFCFITNDDIGTPVVVPPVPPLIDVVKVPSPLALPDGPGSVKYTYTLRNVGVVSVADITMVGDSCEPIQFDSGDTNGDNMLQTSETWVYDCTTTLSETHTNTVVATGWANGLSAVDVASATVVVGIPDVVPPLIHVTKTPSSLTLPAGGGSVTYTETVTNPGIVPLRSIVLSDDKCGPMQFEFGDANSNSLLEPEESWVYSCDVGLLKTTTNVASVSGEANGYTVRDFAMATVVVASAVPALPNTGVIPMENALVAFLGAAAGAFVATLLIRLAGKRRNR